MVICFLSRSSFLSFFFDDSSSKDLDLFDWSIGLTGLHQTHALNDPQPGRHSTEDGMLAIEPRRRCQRDKPLTTVGVGPAVGHAEHARPGMLQARVNLILKLVAVDGGASSTGAGWISTLQHEIGDDPMDETAMVVPSSTQLHEIPTRLSNDVKSVLNFLDSIVDLTGCSTDFRSVIGVEFQSDGALKVHQQMKHGDCVDTPIEHTMVVSRITFAAMVMTTEVPVPASEASTCLSITGPSITGLALPPSQEPRSRGARITLESGHVVKVPDTRSIPPIT